MSSRSAGTGTGREPRRSWKSGSTSGLQTSSSGSCPSPASYAPPPLPPRRGPSSGGYVVLSRHTQQICQSEPSEPSPLVLCVYGSPLLLLLPLFSQRQRRRSDQGAERVLLAASGMSRIRSSQAVQPAAPLRGAGRVGRPVPTQRGCLTLPAGTAAGEGDHQHLRGGGHAVGRHRHLGAPGGECLTPPSLPPGGPTRPDTQARAGGQAHEQSTTSAKP